MYRCLHYNEPRGYVPRGSCTEYTIGIQWLSLANVASQPFDLVLSLREHVTCTHRRYFRHYTIPHRHTCTWRSPTQDIVIQSRCTYIHAHVGSCRLFHYAMAMRPRVRHDQCNGNVSVYTPFIATLNNYTVYSLLLGTTWPVAVLRISSVFRIHRYDLPPGVFEFTLVRRRFSMPR